MKRIAWILILPLVLLCACNVRFGKPTATPRPDPMPLSPALSGGYKAVLEGVEETKEETFDDPSAPRERELTFHNANYAASYDHSVREADGSVTDAYSVKDFIIPLTVYYRPGSDTPCAVSVPALIVPVNLRTVKPDELLAAAEKLLGSSLPEEFKRYSCAVTRNDDGMTEFTFYEETQTYRRVAAAARYVEDKLTVVFYDAFPDETDVSALFAAKDELWEQVRLDVPSVAASADPSYLAWEKDGPVLIVTYMTDSGTYRYRVCKES